MNDRSQANPDAPLREAPLGLGPRLVLGLFAIVLLFATKDEAGSWADGSRLGTIQSLVESGDLTLDETDFFWQGDKVLVDGHYYSHQPPMLSLLGAVPYFVLHRVLGWEITDPGTYRVLTLLLVGLPLLLGLRTLARLIRRTRCPAPWDTFLLASAAFGTLILPFALVLNQHGSAAGLVLMGFGAAQRKRPAIAGLLLALATTIDLTAVFPALAICIPLALGGGVQALLRTALGAAPPLALHFALNWSLAGDLLPLALHLEAFEYPLSPFMVMSLTGGSSAELGGTQAAYLWGALFGQSGLFSHHPILLLAIALGLAHALRSRTGSADNNNESSQALVPGLLCAVWLSSLGIATYYLTQSRNFGGSAFGMRWFAVFSPLLILPLAVWIGGRGSKPISNGLRSLLLLCMLWSVGASSLGAIQPWKKFAYTYDQRPQARIAPPEMRPATWRKHLEQEWVRLNTHQQTFEERDFQLWFEDILHRHGKLRLLTFPQFTPEEQEAWTREGLETLYPIVDLLDTAGLKVPARAVGHYWLGKLSGRLGLRAEASKQYATTLQLAPGYRPAIKAQRQLEQERE